MLQNCTLFLYYLHYVLVALELCTQTCEELGYRSPYRHWATGWTTDELRLHSRLGQEIYHFSEKSTTGAFEGQVSYRSVVLPTIFVCDIQVYQAARVYFENNLGICLRDEEFFKHGIVPGSYSSCLIIDIFV